MRSLMRMGHASGRVIPWDLFTAMREVDDRFVSDDMRMQIDRGDDNMARSRYNNHDTSNYPESYVQ